MASRIIRESSRTSPTLAKLSHGAERLFWRLTTYADDWGRFEADPEIVRGACLPTVSGVTTKHVQAWLAELSKGLVRFYAVNERQYGVFLTWFKHQRKRDGQAKHPDPPAEVPQDAATCGDTPLDAARVMGYGVGVKRTTMSRSNGFERDAVEVLEFLNRKAGRSYRPVRANLAFIKARLTGGATVENCRGVIVRKVREWAGDPKMAKFLRPETLFNQTKFESYLGERPGEDTDA